MSSAAADIVPDGATRIEPQSGPQHEFLASDSDVVVYGGSAGSGKTWAMLVEPMRHIQTTRGFSAVIFRRTYPEIKNVGGMWDNAAEIYPYVGATPKESSLEWVFPPFDNRVKFAHMQYENDRLAWQGAQVPLIGFDQLEHFTWKQFVYMLSRNRSVCGVRPYMRATCNPHPDHWLRTFMDWWIDRKTGLPIAERSGRQRWFVCMGNEVVWADTPGELVTRCADNMGGAQNVQPLSFTFIPGKLSDNRVLMSKDPSYEARLRAMPFVERERLLGGNWNVRDAAGTYFRREWFEVVDAAPGGMQLVRYWDRASTKPKKQGKDAKASWTVGVLMGRTPQGIYYILDVIRFQGTPMEVEQRIVNTASQDGRSVTVGIEEDPGQAGVAEALVHVRNLAGYPVKRNKVRESKGMRAKPVSSQVQAGNVKLVRAAWNSPYLMELENYDGTDDCVNDQVDATSGAFYMVTKARKRAGTW